MLAGLVWVAHTNGISGADVFFGWLQMRWLAWGTTVFAGLTMVSDLRYFSGKDFNLRRSVPFVVVLLIVLAFVLISYSPAEVLFALFVIYGLSGYIGGLMRWMKRGPLQTGTPY